MASHRIGSTTDLPPGRGKRVMVDGKPIALFNVEGKYYAILDVCSHRGNSLHDGDLEGCIVTCPLHGAQFDVRNGQNVSPPAPTKVASYPVKKEGLELFIEL